MSKKKIGFYRKIAFVLSICAIVTVPVKQVSANTLVNVDNMENFSSEEQKISFWDEKTDNIKEVEKIHKVVEDGDYIIDSIETVYEIKNNDLVQPYAAAYKTDYKTQECTIFHKKTGKTLLHITLYVEFQYNGTYAYVSDKMASWHMYNNAQFTNITQTYTKSTAKSKTIAKYVVKGTVKGTINKNSFNDTYQFQITCTPNGKISVLGEKLS